VTLLAVKVFFGKVWAWLKANWKWLLFPIALLVFLAGWLFKKKVEVIAPGSTAANVAAQKARELAEKQAKEAEAAKAKRIEELKKEHDAVIQKLTDEQKKKVDELVDDPEELNKFLLDVGKQIRG
jgi:hypothetical protein